MPSLQNTSKSSTLESFIVYVLIVSTIVGAVISIQNVRKQQAAQQQADQSKSGELVKHDY